MPESVGPNQNGFMRWRARILSGMVGAIGHNRGSSTQAGGHDGVEPTWKSLSQLSRSQSLLGSWITNEIAAGNGPLSAVNLYDVVYDEVGKADEDGLKSAS